MTDLFNPDADQFATAEFSPCRTWRYILRRRWGSGGRHVGFILLNPSTADETQDDPTIRRCIGYAKAWGYDGLVLGNLFAFRATDPDDMKAAPDPIGPDNNAALLRVWSEAANGKIVCGWGSHGDFKDRGFRVRKMLSDAGARQFALKLTSNGQPGHPLYLRSDAELFPIGG